MDTQSKGRWRRVNKQCKCVICNKDSWCLISEDSVLCMRVAGGRTHVFKDNSIGYIYPLTTRPQSLPRPAPQVPTINARAIIESWARETTEEWIQDQATKLGVTSQSLKDLEIRHSLRHKAAAFPMRDGYGQTIGIRLRSDSGFKWAVEGSHQGIFIPLRESDKTAYVCEGPTDSAAALTLGLWAVGRANCSSGLADIPKVFRRLRIKRAIIISDNDKEDQGQRGAEMLGRYLGIPYCILMLPCKDLRAFVKAGGTNAMLQNLVNDMVWNE